VIKISKVATNMRTPARYRASVEFLMSAGDDWRKLLDLVGPCLHDPKAAREPYEALVRAIAYQQLTAKAGDAIIGRLKALYPESLFPAPEDLVGADFEALRACGFFGRQDHDNKGDLGGHIVRAGPDPQGRGGDGR
jgi:3-methyladenine DNA glycosylase/8-oxoguanine DNA glycosylase